LPDKLAALQSAVQTHPDSFRQSADTTFAAQVESNISEYRGHYVRQELNVRMYLNTFQHTHRLDSRSRSFAAALRDELLQDHRMGSFSAFPPAMDRLSTDPWERFVQQPVHTLLCYAHRIDSMEAQQKNAHPATSDPVIAQLLARVRALEAKPESRTRSPAPTVTSSNELRAPASNVTPEVRRESHAGRRQTRGRDDPRGRGRGRGRADQARSAANTSDFMAPDPSVTIHSGSAIVSAGIIAAASSSALQQGRSRSAADASAFHAFAADCDAQLHAAQTRRQSLHFAPTKATREFSPLDAPSAIQDAPEQTTRLSEDAPADKATRLTKTPRSTRSSSPARPAGLRPRRSLSPDSSPVATTPGTSTPASLSPSPSHTITDASARSAEGVSKVAKSSRAQNSTSALRRRSPLRADEGDTCDETDSPSIMQKRQAMQTPPAGAVNRFAAALLRSPMTIALGHLFELLHHADLVDLLTRLSNILNTSFGQNARTDALCAAATEALATASVTEEERQTLLYALSGKLELPAVISAQPETYAGVLRAPAPWQEIPGTIVTWNVDHSKIRRTTGALQSDPAARSIEIVFDEGCEVCTITRAALLRHFDDWARGHKLFARLKHIGPPRALYLQRPLSLNGFHNTQASTPFMVLLHLRLQHAVYPVHCLVVENAPGDVVLGLPFRRRYDVAMPRNFLVAAAGAHQTAVGVTHACLGVPKGYGVSFPRALAARTSSHNPADMEYRQVLELQPDWVTWQHTGKELTAESLRTHLGSNTERHGLDS
jgi:hypothetical protein